MRIALSLVFCASAALGAVRGNEVMYVGGTAVAIPEKTEGRFSLDDGPQAVFTSKKGAIAIPYAGIASLEYGQKVGRRVGVAIAISPLALFSKKRKHYLTIGYADAQGQKQGAVLELSKSHVHEILTTLRLRSSKEVEFESAEAKKQFERGK